MTNSPCAKDACIDQFVDSLWIERGLAQNTQAAYLSDLRHAETFLAKQQVSLLGATPEQVLAYLASFCLLYTSPSPRDRG